MRDLYKRLTADGVDAWLDAENLIAGQNWQVEIPKAIRESDVVIVCLSEKSINREGYVQKEIKFALDVADEKPEGTIFIIPVRLEECEVPNRLSIYHWVDLFEDDGYKKIMLALNEKAKRIEADFNLQKEYVAFTQSDKFFVEEIVEELEKQEEKPSFWVRIFSLFRSFIRQLNIKSSVNNLISQIKSQVFFRRFLGIFVLIGLGLAMIYGLPPLIRFEKLEPTYTITDIVSLNTSPSIFITENPTPTKTKTPTSIPTSIGGGSGKILYVADNNIYSINSDGTNPIRLTDDSNVRQIVSLSPDANKIAFDSYRDLFIMNVDGTNIKEVAGKYLGAWLPDGRLITSEDGDIFLISADGNEQVKLSTPKYLGNVGFVTLSPDGNSIWFSAIVAGAYTRDPIYVMDVEGTNLINLTSMAGVDGFGAWSPDGKQVAYHSRSSVSSGTYDIFVMNSDYTEPVNLTNGQGNNSFESWSLDGSKILFSSNRDGVLDLFIMNVDGTGLFNLTNGQGNNSFEAWSLDGNKILFSSSRDGEDDIFIMNPDGSEQVNLTTELVADWTYFCSWSPDGRKILLGYWSGNMPIFYTVNIDGTNLTYLADGNSNQADCPIWLP
ncbi:MAG: PD40 domain-containing protein [Anaerolineales bacterium]|nr:PD40 domain-containing protein [Anaerolineales bacterium]MBX3036151.1 PD40 domain-containing protein [Anaerolineales bacterium]